MPRTTVSNSVTTEKVPDKIALIKQRHKLEKERKALSSQLKDKEDAIKELDAQLVELMEAAGEERVEIKGGLGVRLSYSTVPNVKDWDAFYAYIKKNNAWYMLERRPSVTGYRDTLEAGKAVPGVEPFNKVKVALVS